MCDQYNNRGCEVVDELELEIDRLNGRIKELEVLAGPFNLETEDWPDVDIYNAGVDY